MQQACHMRLAASLLYVNVLFKICLKPAKWLCVTPQAIPENCPRIQLLDGRMPKDEWTEGELQPLEQLN